MLGMNKLTYNSTLDRAQIVLQDMTLSEKLNMLHGSSGSRYGGFVEGCERLGIPSLKLNDGPNGYRDDEHPGSTTAWPSALTVAATWDVELSWQWGVAMGREFYGKGANVQLGPGLNLARVPLNGRNFEYMSGGDPVLGYTMVKPLIAGIQSEGVIANAKHWVENNQETDRDTVSANVDERTRHELYYQPFEGAIEAGVGSFMCSYNKVNNVYSCENPETLQHDLKTELHFDYWVMSDWGATHSVSINQGLDQEMPGGDFFGEPLAQQVEMGIVPISKIDDSVLRILQPMFQVGLFDKPNLNADEAIVTSPEHNELARKLSAASHVVLKNENSLLPLLVNKGPMKIVLVGSAARAPIIAGGGSGAVFPSHIVSPYDGLLQSLRITDTDPVKSTCNSSNLLANIKFGQSGCQSVPAATVEECCAACGAYPACRYFSFSGSRCGLYPTDAEPTPAKGTLSGACVKSSPAPQFRCNADDICLAVTDGLDLDATIALTKQADVAVVLVATTSKEASDRESLSFAAFTSSQCQLPAPGQDELISAIAAVQGVKTVVAMVAPGAVLTPWRGEVDAILHGFLPGLEYGNALADVLLGRVNPSGRLPVTLPTRENEVEFSRQQYPGVKKQGDYSEQLEVDYRWYTAHNVEPAFPFGHGLSYTTFSYGTVTVSQSPSTSSVTSTSVSTRSLTADVPKDKDQKNLGVSQQKQQQQQEQKPVPPLSGELSATSSEQSHTQRAAVASTARVNVTLDVVNSGKRAGAEVVQLYVSFPAAAAAPPLQLKGFVKTRHLQPGEAQTVTFSLRDRDLSVWDVAAHGWRVVAGDYKIMVGASSADIRVQKDISLLSTAHSSKG